jgi:hypothetical protein
VITGAEGQNRTADTGIFSPFSVRRKTAYFQQFDYVIDFIGDFGNFGQNLIKFDLDGHNLGTVLLARSFSSSIII